MMAQYMTHASIERMNEFVLIERGEGGTFRVEHGLRDPASTRFVCSDFNSLEEAIEWVDGLDRLVSKEILAHQG
jgi:hypothetical protein